MISFSIYQMEYSQYNPKIKKSPVGWVWLHVFVGVIFESSNIFINQLVLSSLCVKSTSLCLCNKRNTIWNVHYLTQVFPNFKVISLNENLKLDVMNFQIEFFNIHISHFNTTCHNNHDFQMAPYAYSYFFCNLHLGFDIRFNFYDCECAQSYHLSLGLMCKDKTRQKKRGG
jgi:hypothetical protein